MNLNVNKVKQGVFFYDVLSIIVDDEIIFFFKPRFWGLNDCFHVVQKAKESRHFFHGGINYLVYLWKHK